MPYPPDLIVDNETVPVPLPAVTGRLIVSNKVVASVSFAFVRSPQFIRPDPPFMPRVRTFLSSHPVCNDN